MPTVRLRQKSLPRDRGRKQSSIQFGQIDLQEVHSGILFGPAGVLGCHFMNNVKLVEGLGPREGPARVFGGLPVSRCVPGPEDTQFASRNGLLLAESSCYQADFLRTCAGQRERFRVGCHLVTRARITDVWRMNRHGTRKTAHQEDIDGLSLGSIHELVGAAIGETSSPDCLLRRLAEGALPITDGKRYLLQPRYRILNRMGRQPTICP